MTDSTCIRCKFFRMKSSTEGICRVLPQNNNDSLSDRPRVETTHCCKKWQDSGQQYYIRLGWIKGQNQVTKT